MILGKLTALQRRVVVALTTTDVHARDIVEEMLANNVTSVNDFLWQRQLRYYWEVEGVDEECIIKHSDAQIPYGYEYMGAAARLVITPMTDR